MEQFPVAERRPFVWLAADFAALLAPAERSLAGLMALDGRVYRAREGRRTIRFERGGRAFFAKQHRGVGWRELVKNLGSLRLPVFGARTDWTAAARLGAAAIATARVVAIGEAGWNPLARRSVIVTEALDGMVSLEEVAEGWRQRPLATRRRLVDAVARLARATHDAGIQHRDFYLCHILESPAEGRLHLIDLHRARTGGRLARRRRIKELGALYMSALSLRLGRADLCRFIAAYAGGQPAAELRRDPAFWRAVAARARYLAERDRRRSPA